MPSAEVLLAFLLATSVFAYVPGPAMFYAAAQTMARGRRAGWMAALGLHVGGYVHVLAAAFGLPIVFQLAPVLYTVLKLAGAAYLIWLGAKMILSRSDIREHDMRGATEPKRAFWQSVTVEVLNPKTALFFLAFLPQFTDPGAGMAIWVQLLILGTIVNVMFSSADVIAILLSDRITRGMKASSLAGQWATRLGGGILVALGLKLALSRS